jgi:hypothetical protein
MNLEMWFYAVIQAIASTSVFCLSTYLVFVIIDLIRSKRRVMGWLACAVLSCNLRRSDEFEKWQSRQTPR